MASASSLAALGNTSVTLEYGEYTLLLDSPMENISVRT
jgi:hypothetical protein